LRGEPSCNFVSPADSAGFGVRLLPLFSQRFFHGAGALEQCFPLSSLLVVATFLLMLCQETLPPAFLVLRPLPPHLRRGPFLLPAFPVFCSGSFIADATVLGPARCRDPSFLPPLSTSTFVPSDTPAPFSTFLFPQFSPLCVGSPPFGTVEVAGNLPLPSRSCPRCAFAFCFPPWTVFPADPAFPSWQFLPSLSCLSPFCRYRASLRFPMLSVPPPHVWVIVESGPGWKQLSFCLQRLLRHPF